MAWVISYTTYLSLMINLKFNSHKKAWDSNLGIHDTMLNVNIGYPIQI